MKQVVVRPAAAADIEDAYEWYESQQPGLGEVPSCIATPGAFSSNGGSPTPSSTASTVTR